MTPFTCPAALSLIFGAAALCVSSGPAAADQQTSDLSFHYFAEHQSPDHLLYCMYGYFASKTGDHRAAAHIFQRCAAEANSGAAKVYLALFYDEGLGVARDPARAAALMQEAAEQEYSIAQYHHGRALLATAETEAERAAALEWLAKAAAQGDDDAAKILAREGA